VVKNLLTEGAYVTIYSRDQNKQFKMNDEFSSKRITYINGDICDWANLHRSMAKHTIAVHCAASKHVPLCEKNVYSAVFVNVIGTQQVLEGAFLHKYEKVLLLSTDKAVDPVSVMGCTKFLAERLALEYNRVIPVSIVRLGNVFASNGSVVPTFMSRINQGLPLVVKNEKSVRYFITKLEVGEFIVKSLKEMNGNEIFIKNMKVMEIMKLAKAMCPVGHELKVEELTRGEKIKERLLTQEEAQRVVSKDGYYVIGKDKRKDDQKFESLKVEFYTDEEIKGMLKAI